MDKQTSDYVCNQLLSIKSSIDKLLEQQFISNLLSVANNANVLEDIRKEALEQALTMMPLTSKNENDLQSRFL